MLDPMRIAITGGTGFIGGHLAASLVATGREVVVVGRGGTAPRSSIGRPSQLDRSKGRILGPLVRA
jgi:nucleoside-diphosphate-sugar epimerase